MAFPDAFHFLVRPLTASTDVATRLWTEAPPPMRAAMLMVGASSAFSFMGAFIRLASTDIDVLQTVFFRNFFAVLLFAPLFWKRGLAALRTERLSLYIARAGLGLVGMTAGFASVTMIPLAKATALNFTAPLFATLLAVLLLGERIRVHRTAALVAGFVGMIVILRPGFNDDAAAAGVSLGAGLAVLSALAIASSTLIVKRLTTTDAPETIALWMVVMMTPASLIPALTVWIWPDLETFFWLVCLAAAGTIGHLCFTRACAIAEITQIQPLEFVKLPMTAAIGFAVFGEAPSIWVWLGGALIFTSTAIITHREAVMARRRREQAAAEQR